MPHSLSELPFLNLYVRLDQQDTPSYRAKERNQGANNLAIPSDFLPIIEQFATAVKAELQDRARGVVQHGGTRCRLSKQVMADGSIWACARRIEETLPKLDSLGFAPHICNHLHSIGEREGLILVSGSAMQGKTTTASGLLVDYLQSFGGLAITIEEPVEYVLKGRYGDSGQCFQIEPQNEQGWEEALSNVLGWAPRYIFVGEVRTPKTAELLLNAATTGHTVITTFHGGMPEDALTGLLFLAEQSMGKGAADILAGCLTALLHQTLKEDGPFVRYLFTEENAPADPIRGLIRENKIGMMSTYIDRISARLANSPTSGPVSKSVGSSGTTSGTSGHPPLPPLPPIRR
jgi:twitching motility protein PilT